MPPIALPLGNIRRFLDRTGGEHGRQAYRFWVGRQRRGNVRKQNLNAARARAARLAGRMQTTDTTPVTGEEGPPVPEAAILPGCRPPGPLPCQWLRLAEGPLEHLLTENRQLDARRLESQPHPAVIQGDDRDRQHFLTGYGIENHNLLFKLSGKNQHRTTILSCHGGLDWWHLASQPSAEETSKGLRFFSIVVTKWGFCSGNKGVAGVGCGRSQEPFGPPGEARPLNPSRSLPPSPGLPSDR